MTSVKAFVTDDRNVIINCPECHVSTKVPLVNFGSRHRCRVKCVCGHVFVVEVNYRDTFRKCVDLPGHYVIIHAKTGGAKVNWESEVIEGKVPNCRIVDLSRSGIGFVTTDRQKIAVDDIIRLCFKLDNSAATEIVQECVVKHWRDNRVGCQMLSPNVKIGFFLLA